jgi:GH25 family lysozyme M1 (1,4-beta-N-acetylmuramidase)
MMLIDVSHYQGAVNWTQTRPAIQGAYIKVTEGSTNVDGMWVANHANATAAGVLTGAYHFADGGDPVVEANHFADQYQRAAWQLDPVLDAEIAKITAAWIVAFRAQFRARTGVARFRVYSSLSLLTGALNPAGWIDAHTTIWAARYHSSLGWTHPQLVLWQNTSAATVPGVLGSVDADQYQNGWTPAADQGGNVTDPLETNIAAFLFTGGPSTRNAGPGVMPTGVDDTSVFGRVVETQGVAKQILATVTALSGALSSDEAAILAAVQGADADVKAGVTKVVAAVTAGPAGQPPTAAQLAEIEAGLATALGVDLANITVTIGTKEKEGVS